MRIRTDFKIPDLRFLDREAKFKLDWIDERLTPSIRLIQTGRTIPADVEVRWIWLLAVFADVFVGGTRSNFAGFHNIECPRFIAIIFNPNLWPSMCKRQFTDSTMGKFIEHMRFNAVTLNQIADQMCVSQILRNVYPSQDLYSEYFWELPRTSSVGYFCRVVASFCSTAFNRSIFSRSEIRIR